MSNKRPITVRSAEPSDSAALRVLHEAAFAGDGEAMLVAALHEKCGALVSLVAESESCIVGHILFSPCRLEPSASFEVWGLAPMAVVPARQRQGIGSALVAHGLAACRERGIAAVVVLGHPEYYPRFGFSPSAHFGLKCTYDVPAAAFMAMELNPQALSGISGTVRYHPLFDEL